jgi:hypothetical protein
MAVIMNQLERALRGVKLQESASSQRSFAEYFMEDCESDLFEEKALHHTTSEINLRDQEINKLKKERLGQTEHYFSLLQEQGEHIKRLEQTLAKQAQQLASLNDENERLRRGRSSTQKASSISKFSMENLPASRDLSPMSKISERSRRGVETATQCSLSREETYTHLRKFIDVCKREAMSSGLERAIKQLVYALGGEQGVPVSAHSSRKSSECEVKSQQSQVREAPQLQLGGGSALWGRVPLGEMSLTNRGSERSVSQNRSRSRKKIFE